MEWSETLVTSRCLVVNVGLIFLTINGKSQIPSLTNVYSLFILRILRLTGYLIPLLRVLSSEGMFTLLKYLHHLSLLNLMLHRISHCLLLILSRFLLLVPFLLLILVHPLLQVFHLNVLKLKKLPFALTFMFGPRKLLNLQVVRSVTLLTLVELDLKLPL